MTAPATLMSGVRRVSAWANLALVQSGHRGRGSNDGVCLRRVQRNCFREPSKTGWRDPVTALPGENPGQRHRRRIALYHRQRIGSPAGMFKGSFGRNQPDWERGHIVNTYQRSSHDPEAVHLHLTHTHLNRVPLIVLPRAGLYSGCRMATSVSINKAARQRLIAWRGLYIGVSGGCDMVLR